MSTWSVLQPGDIVDVVAPASSSDSRDFRNALRFVHKFGLTPRAPKDIFGRDILCANSDEKRLKHLKVALTARDSKAVWCVRGGYGSLRLLPGLDRLKIPRRKKLFIGYSDTTALHNFLNQKWKWPTVHGTMLEELGRGEGGRRELQDFGDIIYGLRSQIVYSNLKPMNSAARKKITYSSQVVGGNLAILDATMGTPWKFSAKGKIVILEDIGERGYRVDRMLVHLNQCGALKGIRALIFGDFVGGEENPEEDCKYLWKDVQERFAKEASFPVLRGLPFGHGAFQRPMPFMTKATLRLGRQCELVVKTR